MENEPQDAYLPASDTETLAPFDVREQASNRGMKWLAGIIVGLVIVALVAMKLYASGTRGHDQIPRISADNTPYKEVPLVRGGEQTPNQDKAIFQKANGTLKEEVVNTRPAAEQPLPKPKYVEPRKPAANIVIKEPVTEKPVTTSKPKPRVVRKPVHSSDYVVQVASLRSQSEANVLWSAMTKKMRGAVTASHFANVKRVDLGTKGIYYRLRVDGLANKEAANALCARLKSRGQDCIVTKK